MKTRITSVVSFILALLFVTGGAGKRAPEYSALRERVDFPGQPGRWWRPRQWDI